MPKELKSEINCKCIDANSIFEIRQGLELLKDNYENKANLFLGKNNSTEAGKYFWKSRRVKNIIKGITNTKACI